MIPEILGLILLQLIYPGPQDVLVAELMADVTIFIPPSLALATRTLFAVLRLNRSVYSAVMNQLDLFLRLAWQHGWMLPVSLLDWQGWPNGPLVIDDRLCCQPDRDWRGYLLKFLRKADPHVRNRWRFHRMYVTQFARGAPGQVPWRWSSLCAELSNPASIGNCSGIHCIMVAGCIGSYFTPFCMQIDKILSYTY